MLSLLVSLHISLEHEADFIEAIHAQRELTLAREPGCTHFDVTRDVADPSHFIFYEIYQDHLALEHHRTTDHFQVWRAAAERYVLKEPAQRNIVCELLPFGYTDSG